MTATTEATRTTPLPVRVDATESQIVLYVGDRKVASAWGPVVDDPDTWVFWNGHTDPYRISGGREGAAALVNDRQAEWVKREGSLRHPEHGPLDDHGYSTTIPDGLVCVGCGESVAGGAAVVRHTEGAETTEHYICDHCACYIDDDGEADR